MAIEFDNSRSDSVSGPTSGVSVVLNLVIALKQLAVYGNFDAGL